MSASFDEPSIPPRVQRPLAALWISLGLHGALIALVQVVPPHAMGRGTPVIEARLVASPAPAPRPPATPSPRSSDATTLQPALASDPTRADVDMPDPTARAVEPPAAPASEDPAPDDPAPDDAAPPAGADAAAESAPAALSSGVDLTFYSSRELDVQPRALAEITPAYPEDADRDALSGRVVLQLKIEADGRVLEASVVRASPPRLFDAATVEAFERARFAPAVRNGLPVRSQILVEVIYDWAGRPMAPRP